MSIWMAFKMAWSSIISNKMRTFLTMLGVIIGVASVIMLVSLMQGATNEITEQFESMGTNLITVNLPRNGRGRTLYMEDLEVFVQKNENLFAGVAPNVNGSAKIKYETESHDTSLLGTNSIYSTATNTPAEFGRFINDTDVENRSKVAVIGTYIAKEILGEGGNVENALGKKIKINGVYFTVVGILEEKQEGEKGTADDWVIIPYTTAQRLIKNKIVNTFSFQGASKDTVSEATSELKNYLLKFFGNENAYRVTSQQEILDTMNEMLGMMTMVLAGIAGISLVVGGIGIMNIMLVSVTERTREIGIRKAIGAKRRNILVQFLIESVVVSCLGGVIGLITGVQGAKTLGNMIDVKVAYTPSVFMLAFGFSVFVGIFFGIYPANKASKLNPIEALRFE
ncbi:MAG: FtsX-like permease family protein [Clostridiaceae bacterium]|nr:FtsX-like permease family protein [Clostridiaceae bacterium]